MIEYIVNSLFSFLSQTGYLGIFSISFVGSIIIFLPPFYYPFLIAAALDKNLDPHVIAFTSAIGIVSAKLIIFRLSYFGHRFIQREKIKNSKIMAIVKQPRFTIGFDLDFCMRHHTCWSDKHIGDLNLILFEFLF